MAKSDLPSLAEAYGRLCSEVGDMFVDASQHALRLGGLLYTRSNGERWPVEVDARVLQAIGQIYADAQVLNELREYRKVEPLSETVALFARLAGTSGLIWGFSGYATAGRAYRLEAEMMTVLYRYLASQIRLPVLATDGSSSAGVLGLSGVIAAAYGVPTLGFCCLQGLDCMAPRDHMVVSGHTYRDREELVGVAPDVLVAVGGHEATRRECGHALKNGGVVLMLAPQDYRPDSLMGSLHSSGSRQTFADLQPADRIVVCRSIAEVPAAVESVLELIAGTRRRVRSRRMSRIDRLIGS